MAASRQRKRFYSRPRWALGLAIMLLIGITSPSPARPKRPLKAATAQPPPVAVPANPGDLNVAARGAIVIDAFSGKPCFEKNADTRFFPASTTKILTALLVIEEGDLDREVVIQPMDTQVQPSAIGFRPGDRFTRRDMLYALLLKSANDVAQALARDNAGSVAAFAQKMTLRARELGAVDSLFANPHGLHHPAHYTTPRDLVLIARAAMQQPLFRRIVSTQFYTWIAPSGPIQLNNHNRLLGKFPGCTGIKTGYTVPAQQVLASSARWGTREAISIVMYTNKPGIWEDSKAMLSLALSRGE